MSAAIQFDAVLLAGGRSSRLGRDKAFIDWRGQPLYVFQLRKLASLGPERIWLSTRPDQAFPEVLEGVSKILDEASDRGPLEGLRSALSASRAPFLLVLAVDLPRMEPAFLSRLLEAEGGVAPRTAKGWEPLAALYPRRECLALVDEFLASGKRRLQDFLDEAASRGWIRALPLAESDLALFANLNTPDDLAAMEEGERDETVTIARFHLESGFVRTLDRVASEEPLAIRVNGASVAVTMRTPGHDEELAAGFLFTESVIRSASEIAEIARCPDVDPGGEGNTLDVRLLGETDLSRLTRHVFTSSSCGICGKATIDSVFCSFPPVPAHFQPDPALLLSLPAKLRSAQETFDRTGGLHASALFDREGRLLLLREDVGRHNALDKVIGHSLLHGIALDETVLLVSGRISFELMQKALAARIPIVAGISAPSSLAVKLAKESGQTLVGFLREKGFNVYSGVSPENSSR
ncbi:MAG: formate dehydrogenase accessory sulfurtransferase FdhD [Verrucomicrobiae bacterium]|nr:formate dehydrogenase accessory sulfurtransferase FdhD [Verrucomicrobiae bacterium]